MITYFHPMALMLAFLTTLICGNILARDEAKPTYTILVTQETKNNTSWNEVITALEKKYAEKYDVSVVTWEPDLLNAETLQEIRMQGKFPRFLTGLRQSTHRYLCFVASPVEVTSEFVQKAHIITSLLDDDPYTDAFWAILTGREATDALRIVATPDTTVHSVLAATNVAFDNFDSGIGYDEGTKNLKRLKKPGENTIVTYDAPNDTTHVIADALDDADLFVTSGHATENDWQIGYSYRNGQFLVRNGELCGKTSSNETFKIHSNRPKSHLASGNCLIGHIQTDTPDGCMATALIHDACVNMLIGYIVPTWYGYMGWGIQDYYIEQPGRFTLCEAFFANHQALTHRLANADTLKLGNLDKQGLLYDWSTVAIYGDPAWQNALAPKNSGWEQTLTSSIETDENGDTKTVWTLQITPMRGAKTFDLVCGNGSQRGGRPIIAFLPYMKNANNFKSATILEGAEHQPVVTENFILVPTAKVSRTQKTTIRFFYDNACHGGVKNNIIRK